MIFPTLYIYGQNFPVSGEDGFIPPASECCPSDLVLTAISPSTFMAGVWTVQTIDYRLWTVSPSVSPHAGDTESCTAQRSYRVTGQMDRCFLGSRGRATTRQSL